MYSTYQKVSPNSEVSSNKKIIILENLIYQGIEFDYCVVISSLKEAKYETIMINCNPETVSTDYILAIDYI